MMEDWNTINLIKNWTEIKINKINKSNIGEFWIETHKGDTKLQCLVDTGSPRSFISQPTAEKLTSIFGKNIHRETNQLGEFKCFNNKIKMQGVIQINITSGNNSARNCDILVVPHNTVNLLGRVVLQKFGKHKHKKVRKLLI